MAQTLYAFVIQINSMIINIVDKQKNHLQETCSHIGVSECKLHASTYSNEGICSRAPWILWVFHRVVEKRNWGGVKRPNLAQKNTSLCMFSNFRSHIRSIIVCFQGSPLFSIASCDILLYSCHKSLWLYVLRQRMPVAVIWRNYLGNRVAIGRLKTLRLTAVELWLANY